MIGFESQHLLSVQKDRDIASDEADFINSLSTVCDRHRKHRRLTLSPTRGVKTGIGILKAKTGTQDNRISPPPPSLP